MYLPDEVHSYRGQITEKTANRVSRSAGSNETVAKNFDKQCNVHRPSGKHSEPGAFREDILKLVGQYHRRGLFEIQDGRHHSSFKTFKSRVIDLNEEALKKWIRDDGLREFEVYKVYKQFVQ